MHIGKDTSLVMKISQLYTWSHGSLKLNQGTFQVEGPVLKGCSEGPGIGQNPESLEMLQDPARTC